MNAVDTNLLVRHLMRDDASQTARAEEFVSGGAWISHLILAETIWVLESVYDLDRPRIATVVRMLLELAHFSVQDRQTVARALMRFR